MILEVPKLFITTGYIESKDVNFKWNKRIEYQIDEVGNSRLFELAIQMNQKATLGLATALSEWIIWHLTEERIRLDPTKKPEFFFYLAQSHWLGLIDKYYTKDIGANNKYPNESFEVIFWNTIRYMRNVRQSYLYNDYDIYHSIDNFMLLTRQIVPEEFKPLFDEWLTTTLEKSIQLFPATYDIGEMIDKDPTYDASIEPYVPRDFYFDPDFDYHSADLVKTQNDLLKNANWELNIFLNSPDEMLEEGFKGTPYQAKGLI